MDCSLEDPDDNCANDPDNKYANDPDNNCANDPDDNCANDPDDNCANDDASGSDAPNDFSEYFAKLSEENPSAPEDNESTSSAASSGAYCDGRTDVGAGAGFAHLAEHPVW
ncbi:hypothetical protein MTO96_035014 [Rhipicephalus appendiculatus]